MYKFKVLLVKQPGLVAWLVRKFLRQDYNHLCMAYPYDKTADKKLAVISLDPFTGSTAYYIPDSWEYIESKQEYSTNWDFYTLTQPKYSFIHSLQTGIGRWLPSLRKHMRVWDDKTNCVGLVVRALTMSSKHEFYTPQEFFECLHGGHCERITNYGA